MKISATWQLSECGSILIGFFKKIGGVRKCLSSNPVKEI
jgi:hypothetical protein